MAIRGETDLVSSGERHDDSRRILLRDDASQDMRPRQPSDLAPGIDVPDTVARPHRHLTGFPLDNRKTYRNVPFPPDRVNQVSLSTHGLRQAATAWPLKGA